MNQNEKVQQHHNEIELRDIIMALLKRKVMIITITLVGAILAGLFSMFILSPTYLTKLNLVINMPSHYTTRYGDYRLPITTNQEFLNLIKSNDVLLATIDDIAFEGVSLEKMRNRISIQNADSAASFFEVSVSADNPEESFILANTLYRNYTNFIDAMIKERAVNFYINDFKVLLEKEKDCLESEKEILKRNEELLAQTPQNINANTNIEIQTPLNNSSDYVLPIETVNPNYIKIESDIVQNKQSINNIENTLNKYTNYLEELSVEMSAINEYYRSGQTDKLESSALGTVDTYVYLPSAPVAPSHKSSPNNTSNVATGGIAGAIISVMLALFLAYWRKEFSN